MNNKPTQLERKRKEHYEQVYSRQPQLLKRLSPLINTSDLIENNTEPYLHSPKDQLKLKLKEPNIPIKLDKKIDKKKLYKQDIGSLKNNFKKLKQPNTKKISEIRADVLFGLS